MLPLIASAWVGPSVEKPGGSSSLAAVSDSGGLTSRPTAAVAWVCAVSVSNRCPAGAPR